MTKFLSAIGHFFKNAAVLVNAKFVSVFGPDAAHNLAVGIEGVLKTQLGQLAWTAVSEVQSVAAGVDKQALAFSKISAGAKTAGIAASDSIINMLIELAVQKVKGSFGPDPAAG